MTARRLDALQDRLMALLGGKAERGGFVAGMLHRGASETTSYWLQLVVSVGIATLGLVVGSAAVVIGAMLVAPLMTPIVGLAMGLASGSPFLVLRSAGRIVVSIAAAIGGAAAITLLLPFHEVNAEIAARTSPTLLDLCTAAFCALAGAYATLRPGSDTTTAAAGTSISISLVPPLCASGFGVGTSSAGIAAGAGLLFLTNLVAIVVVGTVAFALLGFHRVDVGALEREAFAEDEGGASLARALARRLSRLFESRVGSWARFLMPFVLLGLVYLPLRRALDEVAWQVRVRTVIQRVLAREAIRVVESRVRLEGRQVDVAAVVVGTSVEAEAVRARLDADVQRVAGVVPSVEVLAIADAKRIAGLETTLLATRAKAPAPAREALSQRVVGVDAEVAEALRALWPNEAAGRPVSITVGRTESGLLLRVTHLGHRLDGAATETIQRALADRWATTLSLVDVALPTEPIDRTSGDPAFVRGVASIADAAAEAPGVSVCVVRPDRPRSRQRGSDPDSLLADTIDTLLAGRPRTTVTPGERWSVRVIEGACPTLRKDPTEER